MIQLTFWKKQRVFSENLVSWAEVAMKAPFRSIAVPRKRSGMLRAMPSPGTGTAAFAPVRSFATEIMMEGTVSRGDVAGAALMAEAKIVAKIARVNFILIAEFLVELDR